MKDVTTLINQRQSNESETQSTEQQLTTGEKALVNWFFLRLETNYGQKFWTQFSDEKTVLLTKREWARNIIKYSRDDLHEAIEIAKREREQGNQDFEWPDIPKILGLLTNRISPDGTNSSAYLSLNDPRHPSFQQKRIESDDYRSKRQKAGESELSKMKAMLGMKK